MQYILFSLWFILLHTAIYTIAGAIALRISKDLYEEKNRLLDFLRDMSVESENKYVAKRFFPAQILRGLLMSIVLYPILGFLGEMHILLRMAFFGTLMYIYTDIASAVPFPHNIEGFVYLKERYRKKGFTWKLHLEILLYSILFGILAGWLLVG
jgi:hypothetical protein